MCFLNVDVCFFYVAPRLGISHMERAILPDSYFFSLCSICHSTSWHCWLCHYQLPFGSRKEGLPLYPSNMIVKVKLN